MNHRVAPEHPYPAHLIDVKRVLRWVRKSASLYGGDPSFVAIAGTGSGAHLATMAAFTQNVKFYQPDFPDVDTSVQACVCINGFFDPTDHRGILGGGQPVPPAHTHRHRRNLSASSPKASPKAPPKSLPGHAGTATTSQASSNARSSAYAAAHTLSFREYFARVVSGRSDGFEADQDFFKLASPVVLLRRLELDRRRTGAPAPLTVSTQILPQQPTVEPESRTSPGSVVAASTAAAATVAATATPSTPSPTRAPVTAVRELERTPSRLARFPFPSPTALTASLTASLSAASSSAASTAAAAASYFPLSASSRSRRSATAAAAANAANAFYEIRNAGDSSHPPALTSAD
ncbi:TLE member 5, partial [Cladochytrium tenue]